MADVYTKADLEKHLDNFALIQQNVPTQVSYPRDYHTRTQASYIPNAKNQVDTNHFAVGTLVKRFIEYELVMDITRQPDKRKSKAIFASAIDTLEPFTTKKQSFATNGMSTIIAWTDLHTALNDKTYATKEDPMYIAIDKFKCTAEPNATWAIGTIMCGEQSIPIKMKLLRYLECADFRDFTVPAKHRDLKDEDVNIYVRAYNIVLSHYFANSLEHGEIVKVRSNKVYRKETRVALGSQKSCLKLMRGYFYSVKSGNNRIFVNVNAACSAFYRGQNVNQFLKDTIISKGSRGLQGK